MRATEFLYHCGIHTTHFTDTKADSVSSNLSNTQAVEHQPLSGGDGKTDGGFTSAGEHEVHHSYGFFSTSPGYLTKHYSHLHVYIQ